LSPTEEEQVLIFLKKRKKEEIPTSLNICLVAERFQILSRSTDHGFLFPIARGLARRGHRVTVISSSSPVGKSEIFREGVKAYYLKDSNSKLAASRNFEELALNKFEMLHQENPFHIVHSLDHSGYLIAKYKENYNISVAFDVEATQMSQIFAILGMEQDNVSSFLITGLAVIYKYLTTYLGRDRQLLSTADGIFVTNPQQRIILERYYLYPDFHIYTVPYGIDLGDLTPREGSMELRSRLGLPENAHIVVTASDMTEVQEITFILRSFEKLAIKKPNAYLLILGNGPKRREIEFELLNLALGKRALLLGAIPTEEMLDYIVLGDAFVDMSSRTTGFEPSMIEAMAQKKVIIGSEVSPIANVVADGEDGFLLRPADIDSLGNLMIEIFSGHIPVAEIGERARQKVMNLFETSKMIDAALKAYQDILLRRLS